MSVLFDRNDTNHEILEGIVSNLRAKLSVVPVSWREAEVAEVAVRGRGRRREAALTRTASVANLGEGAKLSVKSALGK